MGVDMLNLVALAIFIGVVVLAVGDFDVSKEWVEFSALALVTSVSVFASGRLFDVPKGSTFWNAGWAPEPETWQKWIFVVWVLAGPLYLLWDFYQNGMHLEPPKLTRFQHRQKLIGDLWTASSVLFVVFWGVTKLQAKE
jgi:hypothetical protein